MTLKAIGAVVTLTEVEMREEMFKETLLQKLGLWMCLRINAQIQKWGLIRDAQLNKKYADSIWNSKKWSFMLKFITTWSCQIYEQRYRQTKQFFIFEVGSTSRQNLDSTSSF